MSDNEGQFVLNESHSGQNHRSAGTGRVGWVFRSSIMVGRTTGNHCRIMEVFLINTGVELCRFHYSTQWRHTTSKSGSAE